MYGPGGSWGGLTLIGDLEPYTCMMAMAKLQRLNARRYKCWCKVYYGSRDLSPYQEEDIQECIVDAGYLFSKCDYYGCFCTIDADGVVGWLAIGYK